MPLPANFFETPDFDVVLAIMLLAMVTTVLVQVRCRAIRLQDGNIEFLSSMQLLPKRHRVLILAVTAQGVALAVIFGGPLFLKSDCREALAGPDRSCTVYYREEDGRFWRQVNDAAPVEVSEREYAAQKRGGPLAFVGLLIAYCGITAGMASAARYATSAAASSENSVDSANIQT
jgi:hypothetical protein